MQIDDATHALHEEPSRPEPWVAGLAIDWRHKTPTTTWIVKDHADADQARDALNVRTHRWTPAGWRHALASAFRHGRNTRSFLKGNHRGLEPWQVQEADDERRTMVPTYTAEEAVQACARDHPARAHRTRTYRVTSEVEEWLENPERWSTGYYEAIIEVSPDTAKTHTHAARWRTRPS